MRNELYLPEGYIEAQGRAEGIFSSIGEVRRAMELGKIFTGRVLRCDCTDMSLHVDMGCMIGVIPREECVYTVTGEVKDIAIITRVGRSVVFCIKEIRERSGVPFAVLSRREVQMRCMRDYISRLVPGDVIPARVTHLESFGAFMDIGCGIVSLASVDSLSVSRISHPGDRLAVGQRTMAVVKTVDRDAGRIYMSLRELYGTWAENAALFSTSQTVTGIVRSVEDYGIFVELTPNLAGLAEYREGIAVGDGCAVYIKSIIPERMKVKLVLIDRLSSAPRKNVGFFVDTDRVLHMDRWVYSPPACEKVIETVF